MAKFEEQVSASGALVAGFAGVAAALLVAFPPSDAQLAAADPLVQLVAHPLGPRAIPLVSLGAPIAWWCLVRPGREAWRAAAAQAVAAFAAVACALPLLRVAVGPAFPAFIPPEESARPGMALGLCAALVEEGVFRLAILAPMYAVAVRLGCRSVQAGAAAVLVTALALALAHEIGPGATEVLGRHLAARFLVLGCFMGVLFRKPGPAFLVAGHCGAHVAIPLLFAGAAG